jgi:16S rRNA (cytosine1402-N4)-methyltransferase
VKKESEDASRHVPVLLDPCLAGLNIRQDGNYIDGTFGRGGHSKAILSHLGAGGRLLAIDRDAQALAEADARLLQDPRFELLQGEIAELEEHAKQRELLGKVDGLLLDLGVSSPQLDEAARGFSFLSDGPLDMRMDRGKGQSAATWLANVKERDLKKVLYAYGEERNAARIAQAIVAARARRPILRTSELSAIVSDTAPVRGQKRHPATKTFQAIRILVNDELRQIEAALQASIHLLRAGGRLCVISFHSLEDRIVKRFMRNASRESAQYRGLPDIPAAHLPPLRLVGKAIRADEHEIAGNPRSRSARLRIAERV